MNTFNRLLPFKRLLLAVCFCGMLTSSQLTFVKLEKERLQFTSGGNLAEIWKDGVARKLVVDADSVQMTGSLDVVSTLSADIVRTNAYFAMQTYQISMPRKNDPIRRYTLFDAAGIAAGHVAAEVLILCGRGGNLQVSCYHRSALFMSNYQPNNYPWVLTPLDDHTRGVSLTISKVGQFVYLDVDSFTDATASSITVNLRGQFGNCKLSQGYVEI